MLLRRGVAPTTVANPIVALSEYDRTGFPECSAASTTVSKDREASCQAVLDEEILVREALRLGIAATDPVVLRRTETNVAFLDASDSAARHAILQRDPVVRRRLGQRMRQRLAAIAKNNEATIDEVRAVAAADPDRFRSPARVRLRQIFVAEGPSAARRVERLRAQLIDARSQPDTANAQGDPFLLDFGSGPRTFEQLARAVGEDVATAAFELPVGRWSAPLRSPYGNHLLLVQERIPAGPRPADEVEDEAREVVRERQRQRSIQTGLIALRQQYGALATLAGAVESITR